MGDTPGDTPVNGTVIYHFRPHDEAKRVKPGTGEPLFWDVRLKDGTRARVRSGGNLPQDTDEDLWFVVPAESICSDDLTWTLTNWGEVQDLMLLHGRLPRAVNEKHKEVLGKKLAAYNYHDIYCRYHTDVDRQWPRVMSELLTMHVLKWVLHNKPILIVRDLPKGEETISPCMYIQPKPVFGPARP